ncbi:hypothetical protein ACLB2K_057588 [Fragaria x ananassa]
MMDVMDVMDVKLPLGSKLKSGTSITTFIGEKAIFIAADGKVTYATKENMGELSLGCYPKMLKLTDHIVVAFAGGLSEGVTIICNVAAAIINLTGRVGMSMKRKLFQNEMQKWKRQYGHKNRFPMTILVFGYRNGIAHVSRGEYVQIEENGVYGCGSGFKFLKPFMEELTTNH